MIEKLGRRERGSNKLITDKQDQIIDCLTELEARLTKAEGRIKILKFAIESMNKEGKTK